ncbi:MAG: hypothetical protein CMJ32_04965 [Phycisphaerae bacterium]|nr:hypothetical protein [Phycisphaerae bacterium]
MAPETSVLAVEIPGSHEQPIRAKLHMPAISPRGIVLLAHGYMGYMEYGMFPFLADALAQAGLATCRFNFSHSGVDHDHSSFARADLFSINTWNKQVEDLELLSGAIPRLIIEDGGPDELPLYLVGHSRGGVTSLLAAARGQLSGAGASGVVTLNSPDACNPWKDHQDRILQEGGLDQVSNRTGQRLRVDAVFLQEQLDQPEAHDLLELVGSIDVPMLLVHGTADMTIPVQAMDRIAAAAAGCPDLERVQIEGADHVFNTPNPFNPADEPSRQLDEMIHIVTGWLERKVS